MPNRQLPPLPVRRRPGAAGPPPQRFTLSREIESSCTIRLVLAGELDLAVRDQLAQALEAAQDDATDIILDLESLTLIDATCIAVVFMAGARARNENGLLILLELRGQVRRVLDLTGTPDGALILDRSDSAAGQRIEAAA